MDIKPLADTVKYIPCESLAKGQAIFGCVHHVGSGLIHDPKQPIVNKETGEITYNQFEQKCVFILEFDRVTKEKRINYYCSVILLNEIEKKLSTEIYKTVDDVGEEAATKFKITFDGMKLNRVGTHEYADWTIRSNAEIKK